MWAGCWCRPRAITDQRHNGTATVRERSRVTLDLYNPAMPDKPPKSLMRSLGEFFGHIARGAKTDVKAKPQQVRRTVEEETRETPQGKITLRRTTIEEVEIKKPPQ